MRYLVLTDAEATAIHNIADFLTNLSESKSPFIPSSIKEWVRENKGTVCNLSERVKTAPESNG